MRVIGGEFRSRVLKTLPGLGTRPTPDRMREALFNVLAPQIADTIFVGKRWEAHQVDTLRVSVNSRGLVSEAVRQQPTSNYPAQPPYSASKCPVLA